MIEDVPGIFSIPLVSGSRYNFLIEYFEADPKACLAGVNEIGDYAFDELFFKLIGHEGIAGSVFLYFIPRVRPSQLSCIEELCRKISKMAVSYLFTSYYICERRWPRASKRLKS